MKQRPKFRANESFQNEQEKHNNIDEGIELLLTKSSNISQTADIELKEGDSLQSLSIRYHCPVAELKRLNNLHKDNEIFARRIIKVPFRAFSMVAVHKSGDNSPNTNLPKKSIDANILKEKLSSVTTSLDNSNINGSVSIDNLLIDLQNENCNNFNQIIFNTTITKRPDEYKDEEEYELNSDGDEEVQLLPTKSITQQREQITTFFSCNGDDWGLSWPILLAIILILAFIGPFIYIYLAEHPEKYHHHRR